MKSPLTPLLPVLLLSVLVLLTASSCTSLRVSPISVTLSAADSLMMTDPQSALDTLLTADSLAVSGLCGRDAAYYGLLMAEARYKCYLPVSEDTSVFFSSEYYRRHGPDSLYACADDVRCRPCRERRSLVGTGEVQGGGACDGGRRGL